MSPTMTYDDGFGARAARVAKRLLGGVAAAGFVILVAAAGAVVAIAAFAVASIMALGVALAWLVGQVTGRGGPRESRRERDSGPEVLVARRGPHGWTVDATGR